YLGWRVIVYSNNKKMFCYLGPLAKGVNLGFHQGARLPDPGRWLEGTGKGMRHVKIRSDKNIRPGPFKKLVRAASRLASR
ncbi:DUF1801 domain-containing protein, partial [Acidobacteriia bacterium AH_259_A11_L15]|nr:DUF1801 domain-containing protein [Acidobacteriia bacterium AH_259_A11_L15]